MRQAIRCLKRLEPLPANAGCSFSCSLCVNHMSNQVFDGYYVYIRGWDYEINEEIDCYDGPFPTKKDALDFIDWAKSTKHNEDSPVCITRTSEPVVLT